MRSERTYRVNAPDVTHETIDGEALVINFDTGAYYCLGGTGVAVWEGILRGESVDEIQRRLADTYDGDAGEIARAVGTLVDSLVTEQLVVDDDAPPAAREPVAAAAPSGDGRPAFVAPAFRKYDDMQDFLLVDPVHESDETGWPRRRNGSGQA
jgi:hypothetical protein